MFKQSYGKVKEKSDYLRKTDTTISKIAVALNEQGIKCHTFKVVYPYIVHILIPYYSAVVEINKPLIDGDDFFRINHFKELGFNYKNFDSANAEEIVAYVKTLSGGGRHQSALDKFTNGARENKKQHYTICNSYVKIKYD